MSQAIVLTKQNQHVFLLGPCSQSDQQEEKGALSGADVQWEAQESRSIEWSRCHLDIHSPDSSHSLPFIWYPTPGGDGESATQKGSMLILLRLLLLPDCCCWALHICSLLSKWNSWMQGSESCIYTGNLRVRRPQSNHTVLCKLLELITGVLTFLQSSNRSIN